MRHLISLSIIILIIFSSNTFGKNETKILMPDKKYGRTSKILSNQIYVRFKSGHYDLSEIEMKFQNKTFHILKQLLTKNQSFMFNAKKLKSSMLSSSQVHNILQKEEPLLRTYRLRFDSALSPEEFCQKLKKQFSDIEIAEPVAVDEMLGSYIPNDEYVYQQALLSQCKIFDLWDQWKGDTNMVIGISDGGIYQEHEDLTNSIATNWGEIPNDDIDNDNNGYVDDYRGYNFAYEMDGTPRGDTYHSGNHGSGVAGIACATTDNTIGIAGVAFNCRFFPIKTATRWGTSIIFGYESIVYAAVRGFKVLNCSWGSIKRFSQIDQSIIDYAASRGVAIVAAAGNANGSLAPFYPASYFGVMSVGNVDLTDRIAGSSSIGAYLDIMAPGQSSYITTNVQGGYMVEPSGGTSFASPVVAGVLALVRSKYPQLSPLEAIEFTRQATDDIGDLNPTIKGIMRGRVNGFKAINTPPFSIPGIVFIDKTLQIDGDTISRIFENQIADLEIKCKNILGDAQNLRFVLSMGYDFDQAIDVIDSSVLVANVPRNGEITLKGFKIRAKKNYDALVIFRVDVYGKNNYHDFFMFPFIPTPEMTTFGNNVIRFSVGDRGQIGFFGSDEDIQGIGLTYKNFGNMIYNAGLMLTAKQGTNIFSSTATFGNFSPYTDFISVKPFTKPDITKGIVNDKASFHSIGAEIEQVFNIPPNDFPIVSVDITVTNQSSYKYDAMAVGYYFDWDIIPDTDSNLVELLPEAIPNELQSVAAAAEFAKFYSDNANSPNCGCAVFSNNTNFIAAASGMNYNLIKEFTLEEQYASLNTGISIQYPDIDDINMVVGMSFPGGLGLKEKRSFKFLFGCADSKDELALAFRNALLGNSVGELKNNNISVSVLPNPSHAQLNVMMENVAKGTVVSYYNILGEKVLDDNIISVTSMNTAITKDISSLPTGIYFIRIISGKELKTQKFIVE